MAIPSRARQVEWVEQFLDDEKYEELSLAEFAKRLVDKFHEVLQADIKDGCPIPYVGLAFKSPFTAKVHHVAYELSDEVWIVTADSRFGWWGPRDSIFWEYTEHTRAKAGEPGNNPDYGIGDRLSVSQRRATLEVVATGDKCALLRDLDTGDIYPDSNENLNKYYRRKKNG